MEFAPVATSRWLSATLPPCVTVTCTAAGIAVATSTSWRTKNRRRPFHPPHRFVPSRPQRPSPRAGDERVDMQLAPNPTGALADFTSAALMLLKLRGSSMGEVMSELTKALHQENGSIPDIFYPGLNALNCELLTSLVLDLGAAFPCVSVATLSRSRFALGRAGELFSWRAPAFRPIDLVFLILDPLKADVESRQLVSTLHNLGKNRSRLEDLRRATTVEEMLAVLAQVPLVAVRELPPLLMIAAAPHDRPARNASGYWRWRH